MILLFSILKTDLFPTVANFSTIFGSQAVLVMLALALVIPLTAGDYDLSVASNLTLCAMVDGDPQRRLRLADRGWRSSARSL